LAKGSLNGTWSVSSQDSFVGYRVREQLLVLPAPSDAVGRTSSVTGNLKISGRTIESATFSADLASLTSDKAMRDQRMHTIGLQSAEFPTATFVLASPIAFASRPPAGRVVKTTATGRFTLHGVTKQVSIPLQAVWQNGEIQIVGSFDIQFADYNITTPTIAGSAARRFASPAAREVSSYTLLGSILNDDPCLALNASSPTRAQFICAGCVPPADPAEAIIAIVPVHDSALLPAVSALTAPCFFRISSGTPRICCLARLL